MAQHHSRADQSHSSRRLALDRSRLLCTGGIEGSRVRWQQDVGRARRRADDRIIEVDRLSVRDRDESSNGCRRAQSKFSGAQDL